jgi:hypothetical protein
VTEKYPSHRPVNSSYSIFAAPEEESETMFPAGADIEFAKDFALTARWRVCLPIVGIGVVDARARGSNEVRRIGA